MTKIQAATLEQVDVVVKFLTLKAEEMGEAEEFDPLIALDAVKEAILENVTWFLFFDEDEVAFGCCYVQPLHSYWKQKKSFYRGAFYILPSHRGKGRYEEIGQYLQDWATEKGADSFSIIIRKDNIANQKASAKIGYKPTDFVWHQSEW